MESTDSRKPFLILAIDGGGYRGIYAAHILKRIQQEFKIDWTNDFNLITGTSTGSIIAAGLVSMVPIEDINVLYAKLGSTIFKKSFLPKFGFFGSKFNNKLLDIELSKVFSGKKLGDYTFPLIIPSTDIGNGKVHVFKSSYDSGFVRDKNVLIKDAVLASCSAPTYFDPTRVAHYSLADGGLWANNPSLVAAVDAKRRLGVELSELKILSIGTGTSKSFYPPSYKGPKFMKWCWGWGFLTRWQRSKFIDMLFNLQSESASNMLGLLLRPDQILRINFDSDQKLPLDDPEELETLISKADYDFTHNSAQIKQFLEIKDNYVR